MSSTKTLENFVNQQLESGNFKNYQDLVRHALMMFQEREEKIARLREDLKPAIDSLKRGEGVAFDMNDIIARGEARLLDTAQDKA